VPPDGTRTNNPSVNSQETNFHQNLPELALAEENQQVAITPDEKRTKRE
jgi:hypothetical protein